MWTTRGRSREEEVMRCMGIRMTEQDEVGMKWRGERDELTTRWGTSRGLGVDEQGLKHEGLKLICCKNDQGGEKVRTKSRK